MVRAFALLALASSVGAVAAQPDPKKADDKKLVTKVYSIKPLLGERGKASGIADADAISKVILRSIPDLHESKSAPDGPQIVELDGGQLEVRAPAAAQDQVRDLLAALERLLDVAVDVKAEVLEVGAGFWYDQTIKPLFKPEKGKPESPAAVLKPGMEVLFEKNSRSVQTSSNRLVNGAEGAVSARRALVTFGGGLPGEARGGKAEEPQFVKEGFGLAALPIVSADRRFIRFKLTEQSTAMGGVRKREFGEIAGRRVVVESFDTEDLGATGSAVVPDGGTLLFKLAYAPKDKVWLVMLKPTVFVQGEDDERRREGKK